MRVVALFLSTLFVAILALPGSTFATPTGCSPTYGHYYVGGYKTFSGYVYGAEAKIETQPLDLCPGSNESSWVMVTGPGYDDYVQVGWIVLGSDSPQWFWEVSSPPTGYFEQYWWGTASGSNVFRVDYVSLGNPNNLDYWDLQINGNSVFSVPRSELGWSGVEIQVYSEPKNVGDQIPGAKSDPVSFTDVKAKTTMTGKYSSASVTRDIDYRLKYVGTNMTNPDTSWDIWDTRYD